MKVEVEELKSVHFTRDVRLGFDVAREFRHFREKHKLEPGVTAPKLEGLKSDLIKNKSTLELLRALEQEVPFQRFLWNSIYDQKDKNLRLELHNIFWSDNATEERKDGFFELLYRYFLYIVLRNAEIWLLSPRRFWHVSPEEESSSYTIPANSQMSNEKEWMSFAKTMRLQTENNESVDFSESILFVTRTKKLNRKKENKNVPLTTRFSNHLRGILKFEDGNLKSEPSDQSGVVIVEIPRKHVAKINDICLPDVEANDYLEDRIWFRLFQSKKARETNRVEKRSGGGCFRKDDIARAAAIFEGRKSSDAGRREFRDEIKKAISQEGTTENHDPGDDTKDDFTGGVLPISQIGDPNSSATVKIEFVQPISKPSFGIEMTEQRTEAWRNVRDQFFATIEIEVDGKIYEFEERVLMDVVFEIEDPTSLPSIQQMGLSEASEREFHTKFMSELDSLKRRALLAIGQANSGERNV